MKERSFKSLYSRFLAGNPYELHFAAHSHHFWPDVTREAQLQAWDDAARFNDSKWERIFEDIVPRVQHAIADTLELQHPEQIALATNTHELITRIFSALSVKTGIRLLTTDGEFYSFSRQLRRWEEDGTVIATRLKADELLENRERWLSQARKEITEGHYDVVFLSQVFFNSGLALTMQDFEFLFASAPAQTVLIIDGYHGFAALPTSLARLEGRVFYLGGGYKYAQAGEGACFVVVPQGPWRPTYTGWFSELGQLSTIKPGAVPFPGDGMAFWGATLDPSAWYRLLAVWGQWKQLGESTTSLHGYVVELQNHFIQLLENGEHLLVAHKPLFKLPLLIHGHFLTWELGSESNATSVRAELARRGVYIDQRSSRLRFGFGLYQDKQDVELLAKKILN